MSKQGWCYIAFFLCLINASASGAINLTTSSGWPSDFAAHNRFLPMIEKSNNAQSPMQTVVVPLFYTSAKAYAGLWQSIQPTAHAEPIKLHIDEAGNQLIIRDQLSRIKPLIALVRKIDHPQPSVLIKARIISLDEQWARHLGVLLNWKTPVLTWPLAATSSPLGFEAQLEALIKQGHAKLIASPQLLTLNKQTAFIESGNEIPYQEKTGQGNTSVTFKKAVIKLKVTPSVLPHNNFLLQLSINQDTVSSLNVNGVPAIRTQQLTTQVLLHNRQTVVLGGIIEENSNNQMHGVPGLHRLPLLGHAFKHTQQMQHRKQLWVLITPQGINR